ncbi:MAG: choice-of-anchor X domain-containing protein [Phycisphaerales bacterium]
MKIEKFAAPAALIAVAGLACTALATNTNETEPNDNKAGANPVVGMVSGDTITGTTTGTSTTTAGAASSDNFRIKTAPAPLGIYRHQLVITTTTAGHTGTIRGLNQTGATAAPWNGSSVGTIGTTDTTVQSTSTATTPARANVWFGFGKEEEVFYRVTGGTATTAPFVATLTDTPVTPVSGPSAIIAGPVTITTIGQTTEDTDFWLYDSNFNAILGAGCDDESTNGGGTGATAEGILTRTLTPGTYYLAVSRYNLSNNQASPCDDDFRIGSVLDFPNAVLCTSTTTTAADLDVSIGGNIVTLVGAASTGYDVKFVQFTVIPQTAPTPPVGAGNAAPGTASNCGTATSLLTVAVTPGANPATTAHTVTVDLSAIGGSSTQSFYDDGTNGDVTGGDSTFSYTATVASGTTAGAKSLPFVVASTAPDVRSSNGSMGLTVTDCPPPVPPCPAGTSVVQGTMLDSVAAVGGGNGIATNTVSGLGNINAIRVSGMAEEINEATYASELRIRVTTPAGNFYDFSFTANTAFPILDDYLSEPGLELLVPLQSGDGLWSVEAWESFDDSGVDATWHGVCVTAANVSTPPTVSNVAWSVSPISGTVGGPFSNNTSLLTANVGPGSQPASTGLAASVDLSALGGSATQAMYDDGTHGDVTGGDGVYSYAFTANGTTPVGTFATTVTASDAELRSATGSANLTVGSVTNLGALTGASAVLQADDSAIGVGEIRWFSFSLPCDVNAANTHYFDLDTDGSVISDTELALYDAAGTMLATDDDGGTGLKSLLTFGTGSGALYDGIAANGVDGAVLAAGNYYLAVGEYNSTFANGFVVTGGDAAGTFDINLHTNLSCGPVCDSIDFNHDDLFPDTADIDDFLSVFSGGPCSNDPNCGDIDFNNDDLFPDTADIDALLSVFSGGPCF